MKNIIIGSGPAGRLAALELGKLKEEVLLIEKKNIAGTCLNEGCMVICGLTDIVRFLNNKKHYEKLGLISGNIKFSYSQIVNKIKETQEILRKLNQEENESLGNEIIYGEATVTNSTVKVNGESYEYEKLLIATGARPFIPEIPGVVHALDSRDILEIKKVPEKLNIIGGGIIAAEISNIFSSFNSEVNILARSNFLKVLDPEIKEYVKKHLLNNVNIHENTNILEIQKNKLITEKKEFEGKTFIATGRTPNSKIMENIIDINENKSIKINKMMQTSVPNIYAAGDVTGGLNLTPVARMEGIIAARNMAGYPNKIKYDSIPQSLTLNMDVSFAEKENFNKTPPNNLISISFPGLAGPESFWRVLTKDTGISKIHVNNKTNSLESVVAVSPSSVSDVAYLSFLMRIGQHIDEFQEFIEIHPSTDAFYNFMKSI